MTPKELTKKQKELAKDEYCPFCKAQHVVETFSEQCSNMMMRKFRCNHCKKEWYNEYRIIFDSAYHVST